MFLYFVRQNEINEIDVIVLCDYELDRIRDLLLDIENLKLRIETSSADGCYSEPVLKVRRQGFFCLTFSLILFLGRWRTKHKIGFNTRTIFVGVGKGKAQIASECNI